MEKLTKNKLGQWSLIKNEDDDFDIAYSKYVKPQSIQKYDVSNYKDFLNTKGWDKPHSGHTDAQNLSNDLDIYPKGSVKNEIENHCYANNTWHEILMPVPAKQNDIETTSNLQHFGRLEESNNHTPITKSHLNQTPVGYYLSNFTRDNSKSSPSYHVFHGDPNTGKFTHVGQYTLNSSNLSDLPNGETHMDHQHKENAIKKAVLSLHTLTDASSKHDEAFYKANPHLEEYNFSENPELDHMYNDSFSNFIQNGSALHFDRDLHRAYLKLPKGQTPQERLKLVVKRLARMKGETSLKEIGDNLSVHGEEKYGKTY